MRTIIAGTREIDDYCLLMEAITGCPWEITTVLSGGARGIDQLGEQWAWNRAIPVEVYPADWGTHGKRAGLFRNQQMLDEAEALLAVWDGQSPGTGHMIRIAKQRGILVFVYEVEAE